MQRKSFTRRQFLERSAAVAGGIALSPLAAGAAGIMTATDQVPLGKTGLKISRLGIGCGSHGGHVQQQLGQDGFNRLIRYAYDQGITYIDIAKSYRTHGMLREAIKGLPREKLFILTKMGGVPGKPYEDIESYCKTYGVDYLDTVLVHCGVKPDWNERRKPVLDAMEKARDKGLIKSHGVSCHSLPALKRAVEIDFVDVHLVRVNPQGHHMDTPRTDTWNAPSNLSHVAPVMEQVKRMKDKGRGIIGMKIIGNGDFTKPEQRERSIRYAMQCGLLDGVTIGFKSPAEIDEAIQRMNAALAEIG